MAFSRRDVRGANLATAWYRRFWPQVRADLIHVQHPLNGTCRSGHAPEGWKLPLVVTAHSLFGEHAERSLKP
jgi:hypothetical protein